ncbi:hypothetical protein INS49_013013 [Diaporthe citri]|uniref:uncharacterized protein n=1 Tax=Diaporthe citri TaxID=83186 RepID=UPI001C7FE68B|nr:uncharacterized protein INS49_013013 [Diaporthe citri]KAG6359492.1 hypothetical protein INS49_013013 [Diaporthe citri]
MPSLFPIASIFALITFVCQASPRSSYTNIVDDFLSTPSQQRPRFRYWLPDASVDAETVSADIKSAGAIGAGGIEFLPFYNYGGELGGPPEGVNWSTYGFGTPAHLGLFPSALEGHKEAGLVMDFSLGPNQGQGIPAHPDDEGLQWDLISTRQTIAEGDIFNEIIPGWLNGELVALAAVSAIVTSRTNVSFNVTGALGATIVTYEDIVLQNGSLTDITSKISDDGRVSSDAPKALPDGHEQELFFFYQKLSHNQNVHFASNTTATIWDNGSYVVDHFSAQGAKAVQAFREDHLLTDNVKDLLREVGNYGWEDSMEIRSNVSWTRSLPTRFKKMFGYDLRTYLPLTMFGNNNINIQNDSRGSTRCTLDTPGHGQAYVNDYRAALAAGHQEYLTTLSEWLQSLGVRLSSQPSYNLPMDMEASMPYVDAPESESLQWHDNVGGYRQFSGAANLARKDVLSNELGAVFGRAYSFTIPELLFAMNRAVSGGMNQFVIHGQSYTGNYPQTTWPGYTAFIYYVSDLYSPKRPGWDNGLQAALDYIARIQHIQQKGIPRTDIAFYNKQPATDPNMGTMYKPNDLISGGWSYACLSPDNFNLPQAYVDNGVLAPEDAMFQALVMLGSQNLTQASLVQLRNFANDGLPIIVVGSAPGHHPTQNITDPGDQAFNDLLAEFLSHVNVHHAAEGEPSQKLDSLDLKPRVGVQTNGTWYTTCREDTSNGLSYAYIFGDTVQASGLLVAQSTGTPYFLDAWTGAREPVLNYQTNGSVTMIPLDLFGNQTKIIVFAQHPIEGIPVPEFHVTELSSNVIGLSAEDKGVALHIAASSDPTYIITLSTGEEVQHTSQAPASFDLKPWTLELEHWEAPANFSGASITAVKTNTTHELTDLVSWNDIPEATNASGVGYYNTNFTWPPDSATGFTNDTSLGAYIGFPSVLDAITVYINGARLPPLDYASPVPDVTPYLFSGSNEIVAVVPSTMWNYLRSILPDIRSAGREFSSLAALPKTDNGLAGVVTVVPFELLRLDP